MKKLYLYKRSITAHESMNNTFMRGMTEHWGPEDIHLSCDTAIARGVPESRLEIPSMVTWDAFIGDRQIHELCLVPGFAVTIGICHSRLRCNNHSTSVAATS